MSFSVKGKQNTPQILVQLADQVCSLQNFAFSKVRALSIPLPNLCDKFTLCAKDAKKSMSRTNGMQSEQSNSNFLANKRKTTKMRINLNILGLSWN